MSDNGFNEVSTPGGRIGSRLARIVADAVVHTIRQTGGIKSSVAQQVFTETTNHVSDEVRSIMGPIFQRIADDTSLPLELKPLFTRLAQTRGQAFGWIGGSAVGGAMAAGLTDLLTNLLAPTISQFMAASPNTYLSPEQAAIAAARGVVPGFDWDFEARRRGVAPDRFAALIRLSQRDLVTSEVLELFNRDALTRDQAIDELVRGGLSQESAEKVVVLSKVPLSPDQAAQAWARNLVSDSLVRLISRSQGLTDGDADVLMGLAGEPPPTEALITAWRRGIITEEDFDRGIIQGPTRNEWIPTVKSLLTQPLTPEEAASAVTQGHLSPEEGAAKARLSGVTQEDFNVIVSNSGLPPGVQFALDALNRGLVTEQQFREMFLESRIKNKYIDLFLAMRRNLIPAETVRMMFRLGVYPRGKAVETLMGHGLSEADANAELDLEAVRGRETTKDLTRSQIMELYRDDIVDRPTVEEMLRAIGFDDVEVQWQVEIEEVNKVRSLVTAATTRVRNGYISGLIDTEVATALLDQIGVSPTRRDRLFTVWDLERQTVRAQLTTSQIQQAMRKGFLTDEEGYQRLLGRGYAPEDANVLVRLAGGDEQAPSEEG